MMMLEEFTRTCPVRTAPFAVPPRQLHGEYCRRFWEEGWSCHPAATPTICARSHCACSQRRIYDASGEYGRRFRQEGRSCHEAASSRICTHSHCARSQRRIYDASGEYCRRFRQEGWHCHKAAKSHHAQWTSFFLSASYFYLLLYPYMSYVYK